MTGIAAFARKYGDAWANPDTEAFVALFADNAVYRDDQVGRLNQGHDDLRAFHAHFAAAISEIHMDFPTTIQSGNTACLEWIFSGRQTGLYHGKPPTGIAFRSAGVAVMIFAPDGRIASVVDYYDSAGVQRQLAGG
ncbi:MAG: hypothetical protein RL367_2520 [Pseudomonadota bacterium]